MDYVQRFIASGGNLQIAPDTRTERLIAAGRYAPLLVVDLALWLRGDPGRTGTSASPALMFLAVALSVLAAPSFVRLEGMAPLGWVGYAPLFAVIRTETERGRSRRAVWYGVLYGVLFTLLGNFWLGTFNLISLQAVGVIFLFHYSVYMVIVVALLRIVPRGVPRALVLPLSWTFFEFARSSRFLGYPWLLAAHSQYRNLPLIQWAEVGGVWLVGGIVVLANALLAEGALRLFGRRDESANRRTDPSRSRGSARRWFVAAVLVIAVAHSGGALFLLRELPTRETVRLALIQQNSDPRKHEYERTLESLMRLTDESLFHDPDLVVWSETAFVPNIRRWSQEDPQRYRLARLVDEFLAYQDSIDRWLLTGNDDYRRILDEAGREVQRNSFNAGVLFSDTAERRETYHKIKLVPFTEYFPYEEQLPWVHAMLLDFDIAFWTPGRERTIFRHPSFAFATPICFEDVFPGEVRAFALEGMEVIVNITNDYWSLREVAAKQHFVGALFRTVELRRPMVRSTASGVTSHVDARGRIIATVPQYSEQYLIADVAVPAAGDDGRGPSTLYLQWGDWIPWTALATLIGLLLYGVYNRLTSKGHGKGYQ
ncbi:MAG: apolipoprotein N-acyltransferase [Spirochaetales bacterium]|nr:apolipoprotein N-acyltransferase [Spirochaetales bacterium]